MSPRGRAASVVSHRHHFVPKAHVKRWAFDPRWRMVWWRHKVSTGPAEQKTVKEVLFKIDHHLIRMSDGTDSSWLDSEFMHEIEDAVPIVIDALITGARTPSSLRPRDRRGVALFVNMLRGTVPGRIEALEARIQANAGLAARLAAWRAVHTGNPTPEEARRQFAIGGAIWDVLTSGQTDELVSRAWQVLSLPHESPVGLILGDDPVLELGIPSRDGESHLLLAFPLGPRKLLVLHPWVGEDLPPAALGDGDTEVINRLAWRQAHAEAVAHAEADLDLARLTGPASIPGCLAAPAQRAKPAVFV